MILLPDGGREKQYSVGDKRELLQPLRRIRERTPFNWVEIHPDNDTAFINWHLLRYAETEGIAWFRSRPYKKSHYSFVEQKNTAHVRGLLVHLRYDTEKLAIINYLHQNKLGLYRKFFQPVMELKEKIRDKGKVHRRFDVPKTPYQRLMESCHIPEKTERNLE